MVKFIIALLVIALSFGVACSDDNSTHDAQRRNTVAGILGIDDKQAERLIASLDKYDRILSELAKSVKADMSELAQAIKSGKNDVIRMLVEKIDRKEKEIRAVKQREMDELNRLLTFEQRAKYILFKMDIRRDLREIFENGTDDKKRQGQ